MTPTKNWQPCYVDPERGVAFFDGLTIYTDAISDPRWDRVPPVVAEEQVFMSRQLRHLLRPGLRVLDVGTGSGVFALWAALHQCRVVAIDVNPRALRFGRANARTNKIPVRDDAASLKNSTVCFIEAEFNADFPQGLLGDAYDLIILSPPYNPTWEGVSPAFHAAAGPDGQQCFRTQMGIVPRVLKPGGWCVGNQMTPVSEGSVQARDVIRGAFSAAGMKCLIRWTESIDSFETRAFLQAQYRGFQLGPRHADLDAFVEERTRAHPRFALIYYEVKKTRANQIRRFEPAARPGTDWIYRAWLHRQIVEHTAIARDSFSSPALFMERGPIDPIPAVRLEQHDEYLSVQPRTYADSVLVVVDKWVKQVNLVGSAGGEPQFNVLFVDTAPWFDRDRGRLANQEECKIWLSGEVAEEVYLEFLQALQSITALLQRANVGAFLHPHFVGRTYPHLWSDILFPIAERDVAKELIRLDSDDHRLWNHLQQLLRQHEGAGTPPGVNYESSNGYSSSIMEKLEVPADPQQVWTAVDEQIRLAWGSPSPSEEQYAPHLRVCNLVALDLIQRRFLAILSRHGIQQPKWSTLAGLPLRLAFSIDEADSRPHPLGAVEGYRGGVFVYAASTEEWTSAHERRLKDLLRLTWLVYNSYYNLEATRQILSEEFSRPKPK